MSREKIQKSILMEFLRTRLILKILSFSFCFFIFLLWVGGVYTFFKYFCLFRFCEFLLLVIFSVSRYYISARLVEVGRLHHARGKPYLNKGNKKTFEQRELTSERTCRGATISSLISFLLPSNYVKIWYINIMDSKSLQILTKHVFKNDINETIRKWRSGRVTVWQLKLTI